MMVRRRFAQVDVFTDTALRGNPVAVVLDGDGLTDEQMLRFAQWTNLSETTFVVPTTDPHADYHVRIYTPVRELPFAGHPTLGTCHAWLTAGGTPRDGDEIVQECGAGLVRLRRIGGRLAFAAPPLLRAGPVDESLVAEIAAALGVARTDIEDAEWVDNGPGWVAVLLASPEQVLALQPRVIDHHVGVVAVYPHGSPETIEVRAFFPKDGAMAEDPVTGSLNASLAGWLLRTGRVQAPYVASQGAALGRAGRVHIAQDGDGSIWVGGGTITCVSGEVDLGAGEE